LKNRTNEVENMRNILAVLIISVIVTSCQLGGRVYSKNQELSPQAEWLKKDAREFMVPVKDKNLIYNLSISFRYVDGYQYQIARVRVTETSPAGKVTVKDYDLKVREDNGDYIGEAGLDIWDSDHLVEANKKYEESGTYSYRIEQNMPVDPLTSVMEVGIILEKAK
jgi:gliding motility-associated lipoprotein GldH